MKIKFHEKYEKKTINLWVMLMQISLLKLTLYFTEKCQKTKLLLFHFLAKVKDKLENCVCKTQVMPRALSPYPLPHPHP